jgi:hypothetical protein
MPPLQKLPISTLPALLPANDLLQMLRLIRLLYRLSRQASYRQQILPQVPAVARFDPGHDALMMGYDFHLTAAGPRLIEVNTNAGGGYIAWLSEAQSHEKHPLQLSPRLQQRLVSSFTQEWRNFPAAKRPLRRIAILDEDPSDQPLYPEVVACRDWLQAQGLAVEIVAPEQLQADADGVSVAGKPIDLIYNRHCDFFLEEPQLAGVKAAYLAGAVCLSPNPFAYGLLADKRRMILWSDDAALTALGLNQKERQLLVSLVPRSRLLADCDLELVWQERKSLVFKPVTRFGSRGVLLGKGISRKRFAEQEPEVTLVQDLVPPSVEMAQDGQGFKVDIRLFVYRNHLLGVGARLYQGQVTNLRTEGGGFAPVRLV